MEITTPPISVDKIGFLSGFSKMMVSVKLALTHPQCVELIDAFLQVIHYIFYKRKVMYSDNVYFVSYCIHDSTMAFYLLRIHNGRFIKMNWFQSFIMKFFMMFILFILH